MVIQRSVLEHRLGGAKRGAPGTFTRWEIAPRCIEPVEDFETLKLTNSRGVAYNHAMSWVFSPKKAAQVVAVLLKATPGGRMDYRKLMALLYIADRESIKETDTPITGDSYYWDHYC